MTVSAINHVSLYNSPNFSGKTLSPQFKSNSIFTSSPPGDTVTISNKPEKKKFSKGAKWAIGIGGTIAGLVAAGILLRKHETSKLKKLFEEKLVLKNLPEKLEYKPLNNKEEAIKFAKEVLGIKQIDDKITPEAMDWINSALVNVSNAHKGKVYIPQRIHFIKYNDSATAAVIQDIKSKSFGELMINSDYFSNSGITKKLEAHLRLDIPKESKDVAKKVVENAKKELKTSDCFTMRLDDSMLDIYNKFIKSRDSVTFTEKLSLCKALENTDDFYHSIVEYSPKTFLKNNIKLFKNAGVDVNLDEFTKLPLNEQQKSIENLIIERFKKTGEKLMIRQPKSSPFATLYHEMGHLQDFAQNQKELQLKQAENLDFIKYMKNIFKGKGTKPLDDRWGGTTYEGYKELLEKSPEIFKEKYPRLYEHLTDKNIQETAGKISSYATTSIGEFVADTYSKFLQGQSMSDDIITLYKKYNGPLLPGM